jgi:hypothetical protein
MLLVGTDEITNTHTIIKLGELSFKYPNLHVNAFINEYSNAIFHPKCCWFKQAGRGNAIIGSGNLTQQGLRKNWETFSVIDLNSQQIHDLEQQWSAWLYQNRNHIKSIDDPLVIQRVSENNRILKSRKNIISLPPIQVTESENETEAEEIDEEIDSWSFDGSSRILVAEIPKASDRWNQVNFDKDSFVDFFGATPGDNNLRVLFRGLSQNGKLREIEVRQSVSVRSHNWRFELDLAKGQDYPETGRPTGIFVEVSNRMFLYMLLMPGESGYASVMQLLGRSSNAPVRRVQYSCIEVKNSCPILAIWDYLR